ncbi:MAG: hypothetical protein IJL92_03800, partial [Thermoguttaceae bacterium]|nr:hypothetical protein [Thermoguttaceae bacterium]
EEEEEETASLHVWLRETLEQYFANGGSIVFYDAFLERNRDRLRAFGVNNVLELSRAIQESVSGFYLALKYVSRERNSRKDELLLQDILKNWGPNPEATLNEIVKKVYAPAFEVKKILGSSVYFIPYGVRFRRVRQKTEQTAPLRDERPRVPDSRPEPAPAPTPAASVPTPASPTPTPTPKSAPAVQTDDELECELELLVVEKFDSHFKLKSRIALENLRDYAREEGLTKTLAADDDTLRQALQRVGFVVDGSVYVLSKNDQDLVLDAVENAFDSGRRVVYFSALHERLADALSPYVSPTLLAALLAETLGNDPLMRLDDDKLYYVEQPDVERVDEQSLLEAEALNVWGDGKVAERQALIDANPLIPQEKLRRAISASKRLVRNDKDSVARLDRFQCGENTKKSILRVAFLEIEKRGYVSTRKLPIGDARLLNEEMTDDAIQFALFETILADQYERKNRVVTPKGRAITDAEAIRCECSELDGAISLDELLEIVEDIKGPGANMPAALQAGYQTLVRVGKDEFVSDSLARFDVDRVDAAIAEIFNDLTFMPIKAFATFAAFPKSSVEWNPFVLESFVYRFSRKFQLMTNQNAFNSNNTGAIVRRDAGFDSYDAVLVAAAARGFERREFPNLARDDVAPWLVDKGYMERSSAKVDWIVREVKKRQK